MRVIEIKGAKFQIYPSLSKLDFPGGSDGKASAYNVGDPGLIPGWGRSSGEGNGNPLQYSPFPGKSHGRSLVGPSPWGHKESDMTERLDFTLSKLTIMSYDSITIEFISFCFSLLLIFFLSKHLYHFLDYKYDE